MLTPMSTRDKFLAECDRFLRRFKMAETRLGQDAMNDPAFLSRVRAGRSPKSDTMDRVRDYMADYRRKANEQGGKPRPKRVAYRPAA